MENDIKYWNQKFDKNSFTAVELKHLDSLLHLLHQAIDTTRIDVLLKRSPQILTLLENIVHEKSLLFDESTQRVFVVMFFKLYSAKYINSEISRTMCDWVVTQVTKLISQNRYVVFLSEQVVKSDLNDSDLIKLSGLILKSNPLNVHGDFVKYFVTSYSKLNNFAQDMLFTWHPCVTDQILKEILSKKFTDLKNKDFMKYIPSWVTHVHVWVYTLQFFRQIHQETQNFKVLMILAEIWMHVRKHTSIPLDHFFRGDYSTLIKSLSLPIDENLIKKINMEIKKYHREDIWIICFLFQHVQYECLKGKSPAHLEFYGFVYDVNTRDLEAWMKDPSMIRKHCTNMLIISHLECVLGIETIDLEETEFEGEMEHSLMIFCQ